MEASLRKPAPVRGPIFIVGAMGTGTTLLRLMLDSHERIAIPHETGFMRIYNAMQFVPFKWSGRTWAERLGWSKEEFDEEVRHFFERIFMRYASKHGKERWGEKTPQHTWHVVALKHLFPESVFIGIVRHPGAVTASNMRRFGHSAGAATQHWRRYHKEVARQAALHPKRMIILRYEDLVLQPERVMRELLDWLGEAWSQSVLEHHRVQASREHHPTEQESRAQQVDPGGRPTISNAAIRNAEPIDPARIARWKDDLELSDQLIGERLDPLGRFFGYSFEDPESLAPLGDDGSLLLGGEQLRERIELHPELDIETREPAPLAERLYHPAEMRLAEKLNGDEGEAPGPARSGGAVSRLPAPARRALRSAARKAGLR